MTLIVEKSVSVPLPPERAFDLFTARIAEWWPLETHSVSGNSPDLDPAKDLSFDPRLGGKVVETLADGSPSHWATVTRWDPPRAFELRWHPGETPEAATRVEVAFRPEADGTRVELVHDGFEIRGAAAETTHAGYDKGWGGVLHRLAQGAKVPA
ncbi:MAG: SRPBCC domain-containing protein [Paracoccaceae bacterium]|nr:SRPBCC domain-containing protein [Paracoccaceae bacterium]